MLEVGFWPRVLGTRLASIEPIEIVFNIFQLLLGFVVALDHLSVDWSTGKMTGTPMAHSW